MTRETVQHSEPQHREDDLTLRDLIMGVRAFWFEAWRYWWLYLLLFLCIGGYMGYRAWSAPETYPARLTYMVNEEDGSTFGGMSGVLGQLGLGRRTGGRLNLDKIIELARSRKIVQEVLLTPVQGNDTASYIGNLLIAEYVLDEQWAAANPDLQGFRFTHDSLSQFNDLERSALLKLFGLLIGGEKQDGLLAAGYNDLSGILYLTCETTSEDLSISIARTHFERLSSFYINQAIERQQKTYNLVRAKVDSIAGELSKADVEFAVFSDASRSMFARVDQVRGGRLQRDIAKLAAMQVEAVKNMEFAEFNLKNARPVIQELDLPISPIDPNSPSLLKALLIAGLVTVAVGSLFIIFRKLVRDAMA